MPSHNTTETNLISADSSLTVKAQNHAEIWKDEIGFDLFMEYGKILQEISLANDIPLVDKAKAMGDAVVKMQRSNTEKGEHNKGGRTVNMNIIAKNFTRQNVIDV